MRKWNKYIVTADLEAAADQPISSTFHEHAEDLGGFESNDNYQSKERFFQAYFYGNRRAENYDRFIAEHVAQDQEILSIASGRSANEMMLMERGYKVTCSDLAMPESLSLAKQMFPQMEQWELDILAGPAPKQFDVILCLSLIYLFDDAQLERFFTNVRSSLKDSGYLILDSAGPPDNQLAHWLNEFYLRYEAIGVRMFRSRKHGKRHKIISKHHGYRRSDRDIVQAAQKCGLALTAQKNYDFTHEFERSRALSRSMDLLPPLRPVFGQLGRSMPYTRMFKLQRV